MDTARSRLNLGYALLLGMVLLLVVVVAYESYRISSAYLERQQRAGDLLESTDRLEVDLLNMETGKRGYLLGGRQEFLEPYRLGRQVFERDLVLQPHFCGVRFSCRRGAGGKRWQLVRNNKRSKGSPDGRKSWRHCTRASPLVSPVRRCGHEPDAFSAACSNR